MDGLTRSRRDAIVGWRRRYGFETIGWLVIIGGVKMLVDDEVVYVGFVMLVV
jgi:hypothetical protein